jgi:hypothetical protein
VESSARVQRYQGVGDQPRRGALANDYAHPAGQRDLENGSTSPATTRTDTKRTGAGSYCRPPLQERNITETHRPKLSDGTIVAQ